MSGPTSTPPGLASVIVPCFNQIAYTRQCVAALARFTRSPWELVAIDNGSTDGTAAYLAGIQDAAPFPVMVIANSENRGFPAACNQGLKAARGEYLVLLNNDAVATDGWLNQLVVLADSDLSIGMTGPMSNYAPPPQLVPDAPYGGLEEMHHFATRWRQEHRGQWLKAGKLSGFCLLVKRQVLEQVGSLDEQFGLGLFDDDDLALRVRKAGFDLAVAVDLFVHHFGSRTFAGAGIDAEALLVANRARFEAKWGAEAPPAREVTLMPRIGLPVAGTTFQGRRCRVSLTMIVRNEEENLPACLGSATDLFDEIVVVDTGSTDRTVEIARSFGARVFEFIWVDDFAAARNVALAHATGDYAFWLDADDRIEPLQCGRLRTLFDGLRSTDTAYVVRCACDPDSAGGGATVVDHVRLFPVREDVRWTYRVHEQILPSLRRAGVAVHWTDAVIRHVGYNDPVLRKTKLVRDRAILELELFDRPDDPFVLFNVGQVSLEGGEPGTALVYLNRSLAGSSSGDSITRKLHALIARAHQQLGDLDAALAACNAGLDDVPDDAELLFRKGVLHRLRGELEEAGSCWRRILTLRRPDQFASVDVGIYGHVTRRNLAKLAEERGELAEARDHWSALLAERPGDAEGMRALQRLAQTSAAVRKVSS